MAAWLTPTIGKISTQLPAESAKDLYTDSKESLREKTVGKQKATTKHSRKEVMADGKATQIDVTKPWAIGTKNNENAIHKYFIRSQVLDATLREVDERENVATKDQMVILRQK